MRPLLNSPTGPLRRMMSVPWALLPVSFQIPRKELPPSNRAPAKRDAPFVEPSNYLLKIPSQRTSQVPQQTPMERDALLQSLLLHLSLRVTIKWAPLHVPQQDSYTERSVISRANGLFTHLYLSQSPIRSPTTKNRGNIWSLSMELHIAGRPTYNGVWPGSPRGSFMTLQSVPQCHAASSMIPSTLAWCRPEPC